MLLLMLLACIHDITSYCRTVSMETIHQLQFEGNEEKGCTNLEWLALLSIRLTSVNEILMKQIHPICNATFCHGHSLWLETLFERITPVRTYEHL